MLPKVVTRLSSSRSNQCIHSPCRIAIASRALQADPLQQKRWITLTHIRRIKEAMAQWEERQNAINAGRKQSMLSLLEERGFVNQIAGQRKDLDRLLTERRCGAYVGVDPTAPSLHVGHLVPFMALAWLYIHGYGTTFMLGGVTAKFGDPSLRTTTREALSKSDRKASMVAMHLQLKKLGASIESHAAKHGYSREWCWRRDVANNSTWHNKTSPTEFLRVMGRGMRLGPLLGRDTFKNRVEDGKGVSVAEFMYPLLQAWDWWTLFQKGCQIQIGGADQFGNILTGVEAVKVAKKEEPVSFDATASIQGHVGHKFVGNADEAVSDDDPINDPIGFTVPLLTTSKGEKFGKSEGNAIWLDQQMTSSFDLYQFFLRRSDTDVERYLKLFTFLPISDIAAIMETHSVDESKRRAQHILASEFVELIHGSAAVEHARAQHRQLFDKNLSPASLKEDATAATGSTASSGDQAAHQDARTTVPGDWNNLLNKYAKPTNRENAPSLRLTLPQSLVHRQSFPQILYSAGMVSSKGEGHRLVAGKGCYAASRAGKGVQTANMDESMTYTCITSTVTGVARDYITGDNLLILRIGKWKIKIIQLVSDEEYRQSGQTCPGWSPEGDVEGEGEESEEKEREEQNEEEGEGEGEEQTDRSDGERRRKTPAEAAEAIKKRAQEKRFKTTMNRRRSDHLDRKKSEVQARRPYTIRGDDGREGMRWSMGANRSSVGGSNGV